MTEVRAAPRSPVCTGILYPIAFMSGIITNLNDLRRCFIAEIIVQPPSIEAFFLAAIVTLEKMRTIPDAPKFSPARIPMRMLRKACGPGVSRDLAVGCERVRRSNLFAAALGLGLFGRGQMDKSAIEQQVIDDLESAGDEERQVDQRRVREEKSGEDGRDGGSGGACDTGEAGSGGPFFRRNDGHGVR